MNPKEASLNPTVSSHEEWLTIPETIEYHFQQTPTKKRIHRQTVYRWIHNGKVEARLYGEQWYVSRESLETYCQGRPNTTTGRHVWDWIRYCQGRSANTTTPPQTGGAK